MIRLFAGHPTAANLLMLLMLALGLYALPQLQRATFPEFDVDAVSVTIAYPGASPEEVEQALCLRMEEALEAVIGIDEMSCTAREGAASLIAEMGDSASLDRFAADVRREVDAIDDFPDLAEDPTIQILNLTDPVVTISLTGPMSETDLEQYAEALADRLKRTTEVSQTSIGGFSQRQIQVRLDPVALRAMDLSVEDVANRISRQSLNLPSGELDLDSQDLLIRFEDERRTVEGLSDLVILGQEEGGTVLLGAIADIEEGYEDPAQRVTFNGERAALITVTKTSSQDVLSVMAEVEAFIAAEQQVSPPGVTLSLTRDVATIVEDRLSMLIVNGIVGLALVFAILLLFFGFWVAFWVAVGLPTAFMACLFMLVLIGYSINMMTMVALLIAIGLMMDDAIVISENIARHLEEGATGLQAATQGVFEVRAGVLSSFATSICVFGPLAALDGTLGSVLQVVPVVLIVTLAASIVEAFLILPHHLSHSGVRHPGRFRRGFETAFARLRAGAINGIVRRAVSYRYFSLGFAVMIFLASLSMIVGGGVKFSAFPDIDGDVVEARILLPEGTPLERTKTLVDQVIASLGRAAGQFNDDQPISPDGVAQSLVRAVLVEYGVNADAGTSGPHMATVAVDLLPAEQRTTSLDQLFTAWRQETGTLTDVESLVFTEPSVGPAGRPIDFRLFGDDLAELDQASVALQEWLSRYDGVFDLSDDLRPGKPEIQVSLLEGSAALGLDGRTVANQLRAAYFGSTAADLQEGPLNIEIDVVLAEDGADSLSDLDRFPVTLGDGRQVPLSTVAEIVLDRGVASIRRIDGRRTVTITGDVDTRIANVNEVLQDTQDRFLPELEASFPGVTFVLEGEAASQAETGASLQRGFLLGLFGIFLLLSLQFRSYVEPLIVMTAIPMALIGVIWGHWLLGLDLTMPSILGFVSLAGIVVNDSILLVTFVKHRVAQGMEVHQAAIVAARDRFRPVLLTSLTTIAGLLPLLFEQSLQAQVLVPLVASLAFGLATSTLLVLVLLPCTYSILHDFGVARPHKQT